jgi:hypothetical protein
MVTPLAPIPIFAVAAIRLCVEGPLGRGPVSGNTSGLYCFVGHIAAELVNLSSDVTQESVAGPALQQHDGVDGYAFEVHSHGCRRRPISFGLISNTGSTDAMKQQRCASAAFAVRSQSFPFLSAYVYVKRSSLALRWSSLLTTLAAAQTGQRSGWPDFDCVTWSSRRSRFWFSSVSVTELARWRFGLSCGTIWFCSKKRSFAAGAAVCVIHLWLAGICSCALRRRKRGSRDRGRQSTQARNTALLSFL